MFTILFDIPSNNLIFCGIVVGFRAFNERGLEDLPMFCLIDFAFNFMVVFVVRDSFAETLKELFFVDVIGGGNIFSDGIKTRWSGGDDCCVSVAVI